MVRKKPYPKAKIYSNKNVEWYKCPKGYVTYTGFLTRKDAVAFRDKKNMRLCSKKLKKVM